MLGKDQTYTYRRKPLVTGMVITGFLICAGAAAVLARNTEHTLKVDLAAASYPWVGFVLLRLLLVGHYKLTVGPAGLEFLSVLGTSRMTWDEIADIRWKPSGNAHDPTAKSILILTSDRHREVFDGAYCPEESPLLDVILSFWSGPKGPAIKPGSPLPRYLGLCAMYTAANSILLIGVFQLPVAQAIGYSVGMFAFVALIFILPVCRSAPHEQDAYRSTEEYAVREVPDVRPTMAQHDIGPWLFRKLCPPRGKDLLTADQVRELEHTFKLRESKFNRLQFFVICGLVLLGTCIPYYVNRSVRPATMDPAFSNQAIAVIAWLMASFFLGTCTVTAVTDLYCWRSDPESFELHRRFDCTVRGYDPKKAHHLVYALGLLIGTFSAVYAWDSSEVIDARGIRFKPGVLTSYFHPYSDVTAVQVYRRLRAPIGIRRSANVRVVFKSGPPFEHVDGEGDLSEVWRRTVEYISGKSGIPITYGDVRPKSTQ